MVLKEKAVKNTLPKAGKELGWAGYTWSPITKSSNGKLIFHEDRLQLPLVTEELPYSSKWDMNVLICPEMDMLSEELDTDWLGSMVEVMGNTSFAYMVLTKTPEMIFMSSLPMYCGIGVRISNQSELMNALKVMVEVPVESKPTSLFLVFESLKVEYRIPKTKDRFSALEYVDWVVVRREAAGKDDWRNVETLLHHAREASCGVYFEPGMLARPADPPIKLDYSRVTSDKDNLADNEYCDGIQAFEVHERSDEN